MDGWIKLHRCIEDWKWINDPNTLRLWLYCLIHARHEDGTWKGIDLKAGQLVIGRKSFERETGISEQSYRTALKHLKDDGTITTKATNKYTIITIENWCFYQKGEEKSTNKSTSVSTSSQPAANQQLTTNKNEKNERMKEVVVPPTPSEGATPDGGGDGGFEYEESFDALTVYAIYRGLKDTTTRTVRERLEDLLNAVPSYEAVYKALDSFESNASLYRYAKAYYTGDTSSLKVYEMDTYKIVSPRRYID